MLQRSTTLSLVPSSTSLRLLSLRRFASPSVEIFHTRSSSTSLVLPCANSRSAPVSTCRFNQDPASIKGEADAQTFQLLDHVIQLSSCDSWEKDPHWDSKEAILLQKTCKPIQGARLKARSFMVFQITQSSSMYSIMNFIFLLTQPHSGHWFKRHISNVATSYLCYLPPYHFSHYTLKE